MSYLRKDPVHALKMDRSLHIPTWPKMTTVLPSSTPSCSVARSLKLKIVAEGVTLTQQLELLRQSGCDRIQGFLFSPPVTADEITRIMRRGTPGHQPHVKISTHFLSRNRSG
ncbi:MAG: diguanylate cyclase/phosphodiesterase with extracellular sensor [Magnetococcales bacterium]|nr:diguanylate cyclase/phosphodiesterase with extracellular sensor [Magnetococcales bacterium]HIJ83856.1 EAL domain-containing protein [Magnetococcales bacterium]